MEDVMLYTANKAYRYVLGSDHGKTPRVFFGINPSYATPKRLDPTANRIVEIFNGLNEDGRCGKYDSWIIVNIYPEINSHPEDLAELLSGIPSTYDKSVHKENIGHIKTYTENAGLVAAWGDVIEKPPRFKQCLKDIVDEIGGLNKTWYCLGKTQKGNPKHPRARDLLFEKIDGKFLKREVDEDFLNKEWKEFDMDQYYKDKL
jgi:hypothetical protein